MGTPKSPEKARLVDNPQGEGSGKAFANENQQKINYAMAIQNPAIPNPSHSQFGNPEVKARSTIHNGVPAVLFKAKDYYELMALEFKYMLVGKFIKTRPQLDKIRSKFAEKISIKGTCKIGAFNYRTVFLDFDKEEDFKNVWYRRSVEIERQVMWFEKWSPHSKPDEDSPIVPVWVLLPELPFHCHSWNYIKQIVRPAWIPLSSDLATDHRTRPSMAKVRLEVDLTKPKVTSIFVGVEEDSSSLKGFYQKLEYENPPKILYSLQDAGTLYRSM
ncbi:uncharacterized protein LOC132035126 [Lycium ferocissimum]|uniref:uncharacterized protein LOC132035126 n=1 Tax=Lycium ferocissimum TaxID=112874 RepID=UPI0028164925|nr:uncharacterized protein LOC132035126 [Lycium ferocissimum]